MMRDFIEGKAGATDFSFDFPDALSEVWEVVVIENKELAFLLDEHMPEICSYFEPESNARSEHPEYLDEDQFKKKVEKVYKKAMKLAD